MSNRIKKSNLAILASLSLTFIISVSPQVAWADEGGSSFWISGQYAAIAAVPTAPGWSLSVMPYVYSGSASRSKSLSGGGSVNGGVTTRESMVLVQLGYSPEKKILGGQPYIGFSWGPGSNTTSASASVFASRDTQLNRSNAIQGAVRFPSQHECDFPQRIVAIICMSKINLHLLFESHRFSFPVVYHPQEILELHRDFQRWFCRFLHHLPMNSLRSLMASAVSASFIVAVLTASMRKNMLAED